MRITAQDTGMEARGGSLRILVSDFDGTMTRNDFFDLVRERFPARNPAEDFWQKYVDGNLTHFDALASIFAGAKMERKEMLALVDRMELDPALGESVSRLRHNGWQVIIASAGCAWYIQHLLDQNNLSITLHANPGRYAAGEGLQMTLPSDSLYFKRETGIDKEAIVRDALVSGARVAFAGDGRPDLGPALLVPPERRFARGWLAHHLEKKRMGFHRFDSWTQIADTLLKEG